MNINAVRAGMVVDEPVYAPKTGKLLLQHGTVITPRMMVALKYYGVEQLKVSEPGSLFVSPRQTLSTFLQQFFENKVREIAPELPEGNINDKMVEHSKTARSILELILANHELLDALVEIKLVSNFGLFYPAIHSCVWSTLVAAAMDCTQEEIYDIACGALLQNLGLCEMPYLIGKRDLSGPELELWREHCQYGYYFAKERGISDEIAELIQCHHEHYDGSGFPKGLHGDEIPLGSKIINLCSDFDEMIFAKKMQPFEAAEFFYASGDGIYDSRVIDAFIMNIPLYPLGSIVRLSTKEVGVVVNIRKNMGPRPIVRICYNRFDKPYSDTKIIDLGQEYSVFIEEILK